MAKGATESVPPSASSVPPLGSSPRSHSEAVQMAKGATELVSRLPARFPLGSSSLSQLLWRRLKVRERDRGGATASGIQAARLWEPWHPSPCRVGKPGIGGDRRVWPLLADQMEAHGPRTPPKLACNRLRSVHAPHGYEVHR